MRLLLLNPFQVATKGYDYEAVLSKGQYAEEPLGLGYIASYCKKYTDVDIKIIDAHIFAIDKIFSNPDIKFENIEKELIDSMVNYNPDIIGVSCLFHKLAKHAHVLIGKIKKCLPDVKIVIGGSYPTASPEHALRDANIDLAVIGEGEEAMLKILKFYRGDLKQEELDSVAYMKDGNITIKPVKKIVMDIDEFGVPERNPQYLKK